MLRATLLTLAAILAASGTDSRGERCSGRASGPWLAAGSGYTISVEVDGEKCATASAHFLVRRPDGAVILDRTASAQTMGFASLEPGKLDEALTFMVGRMGDHRSNRM